MNSGSVWPRSCKENPLNSFKKKQVWSLQHFWENTCFHRKSELEELMNFKMQQNRIIARWIRQIVLSKGQVVDIAFFLEPPVVFQTYFNAVFICDDDHMQLFTLPELVFWPAKVYEVLWVFLVHTAALSHPLISFPLDILGAVPSILCKFIRSAFSFFSRLHTSILTVFPLKCSIGGWIWAIDWRFISYTFSFCCSHIFENMQHCSIIVFAVAHLNKYRW